LLIMPALLERVRHDAPGIDIAVVTAEERRLAERLETGEVDIAVLPRIEERTRDVDPPGLLRRTLLHDTFTCFMRADHPALVTKRGRRRSLSVETYVELSHALVSPTGEGVGFVDRVLEEQGLARRIALRVPNFYSALAIVANSDLVLTAPTPLGRLGAGLPEIVALAPPIALPRHAIDLVWHERFAKDPGHRWLRTLIAEVVQVVLG
jgi:DNA-binding transcriptional LysR family regulator